jgi:hypothetical protein
MNKVRKYNFLLIAALLLSTSCLKDDYSACPRPFRLIVRALDADDKDITHTGEAEQVILFTFDHNEQLLDAYELNTGQITSKQPINIAFEYGKVPQHVVFDAWANIDERIDFAHPKDVNRRTDMYVKLNRKDATLALAAYKAATRADDRETVHSPGDIFGGTLAGVEVEYGGNEYGKSHVIDIRRKTGAIHIITKNLKAFNNNRNGNYRYEVHRGVDAMNHAGDFSTDHVKHLPTGNFDKDGLFLTTETFRKFASGKDEGIMVDIFFENELIFTADVWTDGSVTDDPKSRSTAGAPIVPQPGRTLNVIITLPADNSAKVDVRTIITPWNVVWEEVNWI